MSAESPEPSLAQRVAQLEAEVRRLRQQVESLTAEPEVEPEAFSVPDQPGWETGGRPKSEADPSPAASPHSPPPLPRLAPEPARSVTAAYELAPPTPRPAETGTRWSNEEPGRDWRATLRQWHLWPPESEGSIEAQVGAWWATRVGALIAVIGVVFFGIYLVQGTPPWMRFLQLALVAVGTVVAGHWLERKDPRFGSVVFSGGLALCFFTGFAAYAVPAVRVLESALAASLVQVAVVAVIVACSLWKQRSGLATLALAFGFATCLFSFLAQLLDISLVASFLLGAAGAFLWLRRGWLPPLAVGLAGAYAIYAIIALRAWHAGNTPGLALALVHPFALFLLFSAADLLTPRGNIVLTRSRRRVLLGANAAGGLGLAVVATIRHFPESLGSVYALAAILAGLVTALYYRRDREDEIGHVAFAVAMGFVALTLIEFFGSRTRWLALAVQAGVALVAAERTRMRSGEVSFWAVWGVSCFFFLRETDLAGHFFFPGAGWSWWGLAAAIYLIGSTALFCAQARIFGKIFPTSARESINLAATVALGVVAATAAWAAFEPAWLPAGAIAVAVGVAVVGFVGRHWIARAAAGGPFLLALGVFIAGGREIDFAFWINGVVVIGAALAVAIGFQRQAARAAEAHTGAVSPLLVAVGHLLWMVALQSLLFQGVPMAVNVAVSGAVAAALVGLAGTRRVDFLPQVALGPVVLVFGALVYLGIRHGGWASDGSPWWLGWLGLGLGFAAVCGRDCWGRLAALRTSWDDSPDLAAGGIAVTGLGIFMLGQQFDLPVWLAAAGVLGAAVGVLGRWPGWSGAFGSASAFVFAGHLGFLLHLGRYPDGAGLAATLVLTAATLALVLQGWIWFRAAESPWRSWTIRLLCAFVLATPYLLFWQQTGPLAPYTTVFWGVTALVLLSAGLVGRVRPLRVTGLIGLALCLPRIFMVDIHSTFYRIAAFVVVGVVLLGVGFLYHRFRHRLASPAAAPES